MSAKKDEHIITKKVVRREQAHPVIKQEVGNGDSPKGGEITLLSVMHKIRTILLIYLSSSNFKG
jgi:hypothetical protein